MVSYFKGRGDGPRMWRIGVDDFDQFHALNPWSNLMFGFYANVPGTSERAGDVVGEPPLTCRPYAWAEMAWPLRSSRL